MPLKLDSPKVAEGNVLKFRTYLKWGLVMCRRRKVRGGDVLKYQTYLRWG